MRVLTVLVFLLPLVAPPVPQLSAQAPAVRPFEPGWPGVVGVEHHAGRLKAEDDRLRALREDYFEAVENASAVEGVLEDAERLRNEAHAPPTGAKAEAYRGAGLTLRAKHGWWPPSRLRHLNEGFAVLDSVVAEHPEMVEPRYLRLMSGFYLPGILGRGDVVEKDFAALARLLPHAKGEYPGELYAAMVRFVRAWDSISRRDRERLDWALEGADG